MVPFVILLLNSDRERQVKEKSPSFLGCSEESIVKPELYMDSFCVFCQLQVSYFCMGLLFKEIKQVTLNVCDK